MIREHFQFRETIATILAKEPSHIEAAQEGMLAARQELERHIASDPFFAATFEPYLPSSDSRVVTRMARAGYAAGVGPMAAVAGTIAWAGVEAMQKAGAAFGVVDNGGDIALMADRPVRVGIYAGDSPLSSRFAFVVPPPDGILGICTSSATVGPSVSFGVADAVIVFSPDVSAADAWATGLCNRLGADDDRPFDALAGSAVTGVLAILGEQVLRWGALPGIVRADVSERLITAGQGVL
ncbi:hypothetical protein ABH15_08560 [Methanoculleus taiwanensis]|uniref:UPF0280 protein ABH15_08560 n=1 Tax=Methanoculleus taiwanensis TaxID=1550565 RepID=A0A498GZU5_9EURY|nr:hypothetical protein ABH15_08560 [Methanoculleus taiwanensis]